MLYYYYLFLLFLVYSHFASLEGGFVIFLADLIIEEKSETFEDLVNG